VAEIRFPFLRPMLPDPAVWTPYLAASYAERRFANGGPAVRLLEQRLTDTFGHGREAVVCANGTAALTAALLALGVEGNVLVPSFTFAASAHAIRLAGCTPILCDVDPLTWELAPAEVARSLARTEVGAVLHVRPFGLSRDLEPVVALCRAAGIPVVVDAAAALGGDAGRQGDAEVFSLHATKAFGIGEGGLVLAPPPLAAAIRRTINFGFDGHGDVAGPGLNGKLDEVAAAIALSVLDGFADATTKRRAMAVAWFRAADAHPELVTARFPGNAPWQTFPVLLPASWHAQDMVDALRARGVEARRYYHPALHLTTAFGRSDAPVTASLSARMVCLPVYDDVRPAELAELATALDGAVADLRAAATRAAA